MSVKLALCSVGVNQYADIDQHGGASSQQGAAPEVPDGVDVCENTHIPMGIYPPRAGCVTKKARDSKRKARHADCTTSRCSDDRTSWKPARGGARCNKSALRKIVVVASDLIPPKATRRRYLECGDSSPLSSLGSESKAATTHRTPRTGREKLDSFVSFLAA